MRIAGVLKSAAFAAAVAAALMCSACSGSSSDNSKTQSSSAKTSGAQADSGQQSEKTAAIPDAESVRIEDENFDIYTSNTYLSTGNNALAKNADNTTYRAYIPVEEYGELEYCFYFSNIVDSTYNKGKPVFVGKDGPDYTIASANVYDGGESEADEPVLLSSVTFGGSESREVLSDEAFWSDPVTLDIPQGHYLVWEWTLTGKNIPANSQADLTCALQKGKKDDDFTYCGDIPLPVFIGAKREQVTDRVMMVGDSITQGCQTEYMKYEYWAAQIAKQLGDNASLWNCGLGWARSSDLDTCGNWLGRSSNCDTAVIAFGTNDILAGDYNGDGKGDSADEMIGYVSDLIARYHAAGAERIIVFNAPPQDFSEEKEAVRTEYNEKLQALCEDYGVEYFDFASYLCDPETPDKAKYGGHPNGEAGKIVGDAFIEKYADVL